MRADKAKRGMAVIGQHDWAGWKGVIVDIIRSPYQRRVRLLEIRLEDNTVKIWHPDHWEPDNTTRKESQ